MAKNVYEGMFLLDGNRWANNAQALGAQMISLLERQGAEVLASRPWDDRRLAYPIRGHRKGVYWLSYFRVDGSRITEIQRQCRLNEAVLRQLILKVDEKLVEQLVAQAMSAQPGGEGGESAPRQAPIREAQPSSNGEKK